MKKIGSYNNFRVCLVLSRDTTIQMFFCQRSIQPITSPFPPPFWVTFARFFFFHVRSEKQTCFPGSIPFVSPPQYLLERLGGIVLIQCTMVYLQVSDRILFSAIHLL
ncbi:hypothetical protein DAPPUDRAFT_301865 [Daphnia pulex]|uniref:Uncharacterized protein n=1 Tax=Daphnia pulex TaxID=6669 RepID=E9GAV1_DAPPU|nr:hypothetical protein DAPPUDRAFT_301865 [Daphnia pulex]|eukprot:EFX83322.1 hypothetical protein DAPPUDRAFT_301865 [Daphnia pulex]